MNKFQLSLPILFIMFFLISCKKDESNPIQIPTTGSIEGVVTNETGDTLIVGALITTSPGSSAVSSGIDGKYIIPYVTEGEYTVTAAKGGYDPGSVIILVVPGRTTIANIHLSYKQPGSSQLDVNTVALWHFDEGTGDILYDSSPYHNDGIIHNAEWITGKLGKALYFNGLTSYVEIPMSSSLRPPNSFTIEAWISLDTLSFAPMTPPDTGAAIILSCNGPYPYGGGYQAKLLDGGKFRIEYRTGNDVIFHKTHNTLLNSKREFYHIAGVFKKTNSGFTVLKTFLDGVLTDSVTFSDSISFYQTTTLYIGSEIGGRALGGIGVREFPGIIDEIRISNIARY